MTSTSFHFAAHHKRPARLLTREQLGDWRLKIYSLALPGQIARPALVDATRVRAAAVLPKLDRECYGIGFLIAHDAATAALGLIYWWHSSNELHQRTYFAPRHDPHALEPIPHPAAGCVWELGIIDFERRAWLEDVLTNPTGPDFDRYLSRQLDADI